MLVAALIALGLVTLLLWLVIPPPNPFDPNDPW